MKTPQWWTHQNDIILSKALARIQWRELNDEMNTVEPVERIRAQSSVYKSDETNTWTSSIIYGSFFRKLKIPMEETILKLGNLGHLLAWYFFSPMGESTLM